jgi:hypothetical protein
MNKPRRPNELDPRPKDGDLVCGDLHADADGFKNLLKIANWNPDTQRVFLVGDILDRGNKAKEALDFIRSNGMVSTAGNHDWFHYRYSKHLIEHLKTGKKIPMKLDKVHKNTFEQFSGKKEYISYMSPIIDEFPLYLDFEDSQGKGYLLHGGIDPFNKIEDQQPDKIMVRRYHPSPDHFIEDETPEYPYWQRSYTGNCGLICHGHAPVPTWDFHKNSWVISLDGGSCMGKYSKGYGVHRAMRFGDRKIFEGEPSKEAVAHFDRLRK